MDTMSMLFGKKGTKPKGMQQFINQMGGEGGSAATVGDSKEMSELRRRIGALVKEGQS